MNKKLEELVEASSLNADFKAWYREQVGKIPQGEKPADTLTRLTGEARRAAFSGECQDWLKDRAGEQSKA